MSPRQLVCISLTLILCACSPAAAALQTATSEPSALIASPTSEPADSVYRLSKWDLWSGDETLLRGANISQALVILELDGPTFKGPGPVGPPYTQEDFFKLAELGANYVSISGPGIYSINPPYELMPEIVAYYDEILEMIANADLFATIGFRSGPGRADWSVCCADEDWAQPYLVDHVWLDREIQAAWPSMWRDAAEHFRDHPNVVAYKLMVEPNASALHLGIYDADTFFAEYGGSTYDWNSVYPGIVAAIREVDEQTPILVSADNFSSVEWLPYVTLVDDERTAYFVDQYAPHPYTHQDADAGLTYPGLFDTHYDGVIEDFDLDWLRDHMQIVADFEATTGRQVTVEEYGVQRWAPNAAEYLSDLIGLFEEQGLNYSIWEWASFWKEYSNSVNAFNWRFGPDPVNISDVPNDLQTVLEDYWQLNWLRPSNVEWTE